MVLLEAIVWFLPAGFANMAPVLFNRVPLLNIPMSTKLLGKNKTWRGIIFGLGLGTLVAFILGQFFSFPISPAVFGLTISAGALLGDLIESFIKRRLKLAPGKPFPPWDQMDWIIGALIAASIITEISGAVFAIALVIYTALHPLINLLGYAIKLKKNKF